jgi:hypothetical protein
MKKSLLEMAQPLVIKLYKRFQAKHPMAAMIIGVVVIGVWGLLTALIQSNVLVGTSFEGLAMSIQNVLSFVSMSATLLLNSGYNNQGNEEVVLEPKETASTPIIEKGSVLDVITPKIKPIQKFQPTNLK